MLKVSILVQQTYPNPNQNPQGSCPLFLHLKLDKSPHYHVKVFCGHSRSLFSLFLERYLQTISLFLEKYLHTISLFLVRYLHAVPEGSEAVCLDMQGRYRMEQLAGRLWLGNTVWQGGTGQQQGSVLTLGPGPAMVEVVSVGDRDHL